MEVSGQGETRKRPGLWLPLCAHPPQSTFLRPPSASLSRTTPPGAAPAHRRPSPGYSIVCSSAAATTPAKGRNASSVNSSWVHKAVRAIKKLKRRRLTGATQGQRERQRRGRRPMTSKLSKLTAGLGQTPVPTTPTGSKTRWEKRGPWGTPYFRITGCCGVTDLLCSGQTRTDASAPRTVTFGRRHDLSH